MDGYVAGALASALLEGALCLWFVLRATGLKPQWFQWLIAPGLAALLAALTSNLLLGCLERDGVPPLPAGGLCLAFGLTLYLSALHAQGLELRRTFRIRW